MQPLFFHRWRHIASSLCAAAIGLFCASGVQAQNNIFPPSGFAGIGTNNPQAHLHIYGIDGVSPYPSILFGYGVDFGGQTGITNADGVPSLLAQRGDYFIRTAARSNNLVLTAQSDRGQIRFGTSVLIGAQLVEREAVTISSVPDGKSQKGHTQLDVKTADRSGNAIMRFYNERIARGKDDAPWMMGLDANHDFTVTHQLPMLPVFRIGLDDNPNSPTFLADRSFLTILRDGRVILGKPIDPSSGLFDSKLSVEGRIVANELVCVGIENWADFVFDDSYRLPALSEVEQHIQEHKHLPDIPSAAEVSRDGVNVVEMQAKLLQKVEELTLYVIDQNKKMSEQNRRIEQLEAELSAERNRTGEQR